MLRATLLLCGPVLLAACGRAPDPATARPTPTPTPSALAVLIVEPTPLPKAEVSLRKVVAIAPVAPPAVATRKAEPRKSVPDPPGAARARVLAAAQKVVGTTERTGRNDGPVIEDMQRRVGIKRGDPYCAAYNFYAYDEAGLAAKVPRSGWSPDWVSNPTWTATKGGAEPRPGDSFGIYFPAKKRVAHTGLVREWKAGQKIVITLEANTSPEPATGEADRNGDGIWSKRRPLRQIYATRSWLTPE